MSSAPTLEAEYGSKTWPTLLSSVARPPRELLAPIYLPREVVRPVRRTRRLLEILEFVCAKGFCFLVLFSAAYGASTMVGQVALEQSRQEGVQAKEGFEAAQRSERAARVQLQELTRPDLIASWALGNGFIDPAAAPAKAE